MSRRKSNASKRSVARRDQPPSPSASSPSTRGDEGGETPAPPEAPAARAFDVAVVGAGIGGLAVAALLARGGRSVVLLERSGEVGGACQRVVHDGQPFEAGTTLITGAGPQGALSTLLARLEIDLPMTASDPTLQVALPRHRLTFHRDPERWWPEIRREVPADEAAWRSLILELTSLASDRDRVMQGIPPLPPVGWRARLRLWRALARQRLSGASRQAVRRLQQAEGTPLRETLAGFGLGAVSRQALEACCWYLVLRGAEECSTLEAALALRRLSEGAVEFADGPMTLAAALVDRLRRDGGEVRLLTEAGGCLVERGRVRGVVTRAGETIRARQVVTDIPPANLVQGMLPQRRRFLSRPKPIEGPWRPLAVAQVMGLVVPEAYLPAELGSHCLVVRDAARPATGENLAFVRLAPDREGERAPDRRRRLSVGRFVPPSLLSESAPATEALLPALEQVVPGIDRAAVQRAVFSSAALGEFWGRPQASVRYEPDSRQWLGRRGQPHQTEWPGLLTIGEWTYPGRLISDVVEGAIEVADHLAALG